LNDNVTSSVLVGQIRSDSNINFYLEVFLSRDLEVAVAFLCDERSSPLYFFQTLVVFYSFFFDLTEEFTYKTGVSFKIKSNFEEANENTFPRQSIQK
jgi:hypothetical protein